MTIGLALGGGAGLGWAHIGVINVLQEEDIPIDVVSGTSIGSIVGACVAADIIDELETIAREVTLKEMLSMGEFGFSQGSLIGGGRIERRLRDHFGTATIEELQLPFAAVAADLYSGERIVLDAGDVVTALRASSAIPGMLPPVETQHLLLVDGGIVDPVPVAAARELGADKIIAVDLQGDYEGRSRRLGFDPINGKPAMAALKTARAGWSLALKSLSQANLAADRPDVTIVPRIGHIDMADFTQADELIALGKKATYDMLTEIECMLQRD
ncbi:MAG: patatin-like phospholipase family protein [Kordiimonadaceae bacterium]|nr:patatin-like phospholipase family protein [Kordiimonadaceae bacterium]MBO6570116.1 patatin-like phospholipase family protein [Kordiimonadaceae bacterium]MBO6965786.1 patatin-like phospholipase family protein [Kordiimonadaceae bacterium]